MRNFIKTGFIAFFILSLAYTSIAYAASEAKGIEEDFSLEVKMGEDVTEKTRDLFFGISPINVRSGEFSESFNNGDRWIKVKGAYDKNTGEINGQVEFSYSQNGVNGYGNAYTEVFTRSAALTAIILKDQKTVEFNRTNPNHGKQTVVKTYQRDAAKSHTAVYDTTVIFSTNIVYGQVDFEQKIEEPEEESGDEKLKKTQKELDKEYLENGKPVNSGATFSGLNGQVEIHIPGTPPGTWKLLNLRDGIPNGSMIRTQEDSSAVIGFSDYSTFVLKPESTIIIAIPTEKFSKIKLVAGTVLVNIKKMVKDGSMEVEMNQAVAGIKGTTFVLNEMNGLSSLKVIEGKVSFTSKSDGKQVDVAGGSAVSASSIGLGKTESFDVAKETDDWEMFKKTTEANASPNKELLGLQLKYIYILIGIIGAVLLFFATKNTFRKK
jgi:hypothetical protein